MKLEDALMLEKFARTLKRLSILKEWHEVKELWCGLTNEDYFTLVAKKAMWKHSKSLANLN